MNKLKILAFIPGSRIRLIIFFKSRLDLVIISTEEIV